MATTEKSLDEFLGEETQEREGFCIDTREMAIWAMRKIAQLTAEIKANRAAADKEIERIESWVATVNEPHQDSIDFFASHLEGWHRKLFAETEGKEKTIKLPHGTLRLRAQQPEFVRNDKALITYIKKNDQHDFIKVVESVDWTNFKKELAVEEDGTVVLKNWGVVLDSEIISAIKKGEKFSIDVVVG